MPKRARTKGFQAWLVRWYIRGDKVPKKTGTVITLLPYNYSRDTVRRIVEALYSAYTQTFDGQANYARRRQPRAEITFDGEVKINKNPGLLAVLATEIKIDCDGMKQTISWRDPDSFAPCLGYPYYQKVASGAQYRIGFDFDHYVQTDYPVLREAENSQVAS